MAHLFAPFVLFTLDGTLFGSNCVILQLMAHWAKVSYLQLMAIFLALVNCLHLIAQSSISGLLFALDGSLFDARCFCT